VIGYYVHHLGRGHLEMARCIAARLDEHVTGLSSLSRPRDWPGDWLKLPRDDTGGSAIEPTARGQLHWGSAVITLVAGRHAHLALHRRGLLASSVRPDLHVLVAMNDPAARGVLDGGTPGPDVVELRCRARPVVARARGVCEQYYGYGGEDTDFGQLAARRGVVLTWIGRAWAYHQYHPSPDPPVQHLHDIIRNAGIFHRRWGWGPMGGWLHEFERRGLTAFDGRAQTWRAVSTRDPAGGSQGGRRSGNATTIRPAITRPPARLAARVTSHRRSSRSHEP
jgi:hypothetical protein